MANKLDINPSRVAAEALSVLSDELVIGNLIYRDKQQEFAKQDGYAVGDTVNIKQRPDYEAKEFTAGGSITVQDVRESKRSLQIEKHFDVSIQLGARELALDFDGFTEQVINPAATRLAEKADAYLGTKILEAAGQYNAASVLGSAADVAAANEAATRQRISRVGRFCLTGLTLETRLVGADWFNQAQIGGAAAENTMVTGAMGRRFGLDFFSSINMPETAHTVANLVGLTDNTVATDNLIGNTALVVDGTTTTTINAGDRIKIAGVRTPLICATTTAATVTSIPLVDPITEIIPDNAAVTVVASGLTYTSRGVITEGTAFAYAAPPLDQPSSVSSAVVTMDGFSIRVTQGYDMDTKKETMSLDMLIGATAWDPRLSLLLTDGS